jgi:hypothetical protein
MQSAQSRRTAPAGNQNVRPGGPQPSINSAQMFANQARPGNGPNIPSGRLAGQQASMAQKQMMQQQQQQQGQQSQGIEGISKMTVAQAITLITLRLGVLETKLHQMDQTPQSSMSFSMDGQENMAMIDKGLLDSIVSRLESLEKRGTGAGQGTSAGAPELTLLKQQVETLKPVVVQTKNASAALVKENKDMKYQMEELKRELESTKETLSVLQNMTMDHGQKLMLLSMNNGDSLDTNLDFNTDENDMGFGEGTDLTDLSSADIDMSEVV